MADVITAPDRYDGAPPSLFLAGGITNCPDWQTEAIELLAGFPGVLFNPRRADFPIDDPSAAADQIAWEFEHLRRAEVVLFWFAESVSVQPIALYELGAHAATGKLIVVGTDPRYQRRADVVLQLGLVRPDVKVHSTLADTCAAIDLRGIIL